MTGEPAPPDPMQCKTCGLPHAGSRGEKTCKAHVKNGKRKGMPCRNDPMTEQEVCRLHGGSAPQNRKAAARRIQKARVTESMDEYFAQRPHLLQEDIVPARALADQLGRWVRRATYLHVIVDASSMDELKQLDMSGKFERPAVWWDMLKSAEAELRATAKVMDDQQLGDRMVTLAEREGARLASCIRRILERLDLSPEQARGAPVIVTEELRELSGGAG